MYLALDFTNLGRFLAKQAKDLKAGIRIVLGALSKVFEFHHPNGIG